MARSPLHASSDRACLCSLYRASTRPSLTPRTRIQTLAHPMPAPTPCLMPPPHILTSPGSMSFMGPNVQLNAKQLLREDDSLLRQIFFNVLKHHHPQLAAKVGGDESSATMSHRW